MLTSQVKNRVTAHYEKVFTSKEQFYDDIHKNYANYNTSAHKFKLNSCRRVWLGKEKTDIQKAANETLNLLNEVIERNKNNKLVGSFISETELQTGDIKTFVQGICFYDKITESYYKHVKIEQRIGLWEFNLKDVEDTGILPTVGYTDEELQQFQIIQKAIDEKIPLKIEADIKPEVLKEFSDLCKIKDSTQPAYVSFYT